MRNILMGNSLLFSVKWKEYKQDATYTLYILQQFQPRRNEKAVALRSKDVAYILYIL